MTTLPEWLKVGTSFRANRRLYHCRGFVDDQAVLRYWRQSKQRWEYVCEDWTYFEVGKDHITGIKEPVIVVMDDLDGPPPTDEQRQKTIALFREGAANRPED